MINIKNISNNFPITFSIKKLDSEVAQNYEIKGYRSYTLVPQSSVEVENTFAEELRKMYPQYISVDNSHTQIKLTETEKELAKIKAENAALKKNTTKGKKNAPDFEEERNETLIADQV